MWRDRTNLYISYRQSYAHHPAKKTRYGPGPGHSFGGGRSSGNARFGGGGGGGEDQQGLLSHADTHDDPYGLDYYGDGLGIGDRDAVIEMDVLPPRWADVSDEVTELLSDIAQRSRVLERLHQKHVLPTFGDWDDDDGTAPSEDRRAEEAEIERLTQAITRGFHDCHRAIQRIERLVRDSRDNPGGAAALTRAEETMAKNVQISLAARVQEASANFRKKQSAYLKKLRDMSGLGTSSPIGGERSSTPLGGSSSLTTSAAAYAADPSLLESDADRSYSQTALQQAQQQVVRGGKGRTANEAAISQREREIEDIAQGIIELADIFRDLHTMVIDQGTMLDRIDYNVERMAVDVKAADRELVVADGYQRRTTKRKLILLLLLLIAGAIILLVIKPKKHASGGGGGSGGGDGDPGGGGGGGGGNNNPDAGDMGQADTG